MRIILAVLVAYVAVALGSLQLASIHISSSPVWPPTGLAIGALVIWGTRLWPAILVGAFLANAFTSGHIPSSATIAAGNALEAFVGATLIRQLGGIRLFDNMRGILGLASTGAVASGISATVGVGSLIIFGLAPLDAAPNIWLTWWLGNLSGALLVLPVMLTWRTPTPRDLALFATSVATGIVAFATTGWTLLILPFLMYWPLRQRDKASIAWALVGLATGAITMTLLGLGPFWGKDSNEALLLLQLFLIAVAAATQILGAGQHTRATLPSRWVTLGASALVLGPLLVGALFVGTTLQPAVAELDDRRQDVLRASILDEWQDLVDEQKGQLDTLKALFEASNVTTPSFAQFVETSDWQFGPGISTAVGYAPYITSGELAAFVNETRNDLALPDVVRESFDVFPPSNASLHAPVRYVYPMDPSPGAIGFDLLASPSHAAALQLADARQAIVASTPLAIVLPGGDAWGIMVAAPVQQANETIGFVTSVVAVAETENLPRAGNAEYQIRDVTEQNLTLLATGNFSWGEPELLEVWGRTWEMAFAIPSQATITEAAAAWFIVMSTGALSAAVGAVAYAYDTSRDRAIQLGNEMVSRVRRDQERLAEIQRLEDLDEFRSQFLNMVAHELRTPLTPIRTQGYILRKQATPEMAKSLEILDRGVLRLNSVVDDLLVAAKAEAGKLKLNVSEASLGQLARDSVEAHAPAAAATNTKLRVTGDVTAHVDPQRISQVLDNLISNAIRFAGDGTVEVHVYEEDGPRIRVSDDGEGIARDQLADLGKPFSQAHNGRGGTGLGLYICKTLAKLHGGTLEIKSEGRNKGTQVTLHLPGEPPEEP